jgi:type VI secretion system protein ImpF
MKQPEKPAQRWELPLLKRLIDKDRWVTCVEVRFTVETVGRLQLSLQAFSEILAGIDLHLVKGQSQLAQDDLPDLAYGSDVTLCYVAGRSAPSVDQLKQTVVRPPGALQGVAVQSICDLRWITTLNRDLDVGNTAAPSAQRLREALKNDLELLLNTSSPHGVIDLDSYEQVQRSVLNYGIPAVTGVACDDQGSHWIAEKISKAIEYFEPRLRGVRVTPEASPRNAHETVLSFRVEARLWDNTASVSLHTRFDVNSGRVQINDAGGV